MKVKLRVEDWEDAKQQAETILRQTEISRVVNENLLNIAIKEIAKFPKIDVPVKLPIGV